MRAVILAASRRRSVARLATSLSISRRVVKRFVAGESLAEAQPVLARLHARGFATTVDVLGEACTSVADARFAGDRYLATLDGLAAAGLDRNVSLKLSALGFDVDRRECLAQVGRIVARAGELGGFVRIDMEDHTRTDGTLEIARAIHADRGNVGVVIQSYLRRSAADVGSLCAEGIRVRLCKGAYAEPPAVAFRSRAEVDGSFRDLAACLLERGDHPAFATHDATLVDWIRAHAAHAGIGPDRYEFQALHGVRRDLQERLRRDGHVMRVYVPFGSEWYPYFMRRLAERPANVASILRSLGAERLR